MSGKRWFKPLLILLAALCFLEVGYMQKKLNWERHELGLNRITPLDNAPPLLAFTTVALGGFRGLIANILWIRASELFDDGKYFELMQLSDWITKLQPTFAGVWVNQAWNLAYNISVKFTEPKDRWRWVSSGVELLRDQALVYNPREPLIYRELAWFFQHKIGAYLDDAHFYYKTQWYLQMTELFGGKPPDYDQLLKPTTPEARARLDLLRKKFKMDPLIMKEVDESYGPLEWRLPETHAIYWATAGMKNADKTNDLIILRRTIYQPLKLSFERGRLIENKFTGRIELAPNLDMIPRANNAYLKMMAEDPPNKDHIQIAHKNFLKDAIYYLFTYNRMIEAKRWFDYYAKEYPDKPMLANDGKSLPGMITLDEYAVARVTETIDETSPDHTRAILEGYLSNSFYNLAMGEDERATGLALLAQKIWNKYEKDISQADNDKRVGLPPLDKIRRETLQSIVADLKESNPEMAAQLLSRVGQTAESISKPAEKK